MDDKITINGEEYVKVAALEELKKAEEDKATEETTTSE